jgi:hypothetical protein
VKNGWKCAFPKQLHCAKRSALVSEIIVMTAAKNLTHSNEGGLDSFSIMSFMRTACPNALVSTRGNPMVCM